MIGVDFDELLAQLSDARVADEELHRRGASLLERMESRDRLMSLRAGLAQARKVVATPAMSVDGTLDSRVRRGIVVE